MLEQLNFRPVGLQLHLGRPFQSPVREAGLHELQFGLGQREDGEGLTHRQAEGIQGLLVVGGSVWRGGEGRRACEAEKGQESEHEEAHG